MKSRPAIFLICIALSCLTHSGLTLASQARLSEEFTGAGDSLALRLERRMGLHSELQLISVARSGKKLNFRFSRELSDYPWRRSDINWFRRELRSLFPAKYAAYTVGRVRTRHFELEELSVPEAGNSGDPARLKFRRNKPSGTVLVSREKEKNWGKGLSGRHIALWQSHGRYYEEKTRRWEWQRAQNFSTVEDIYTQSYVLPFLIPMLENAGACVLTPRERDTQRHESVCDNDTAFDGDRTGLRTKGAYRETGRWSDAGSGFADVSPAYTGYVNPFRCGTARKAACSRKGGATAVWTADLPEKGDYSVYVSYASLPESSDKARYTVSHKGGKSVFLVNQKMGGGMWIYLGTFHFDKGSDATVVLDNQGESGTVVSADAVRFGGGMGKIARGPADEPDSLWTVSGLPSYLEGASYNMQWSGADSTVIFNWDDDYTRDYAARGAWVRNLCGSSSVNPLEPGKGIPVDLALAFHSDAGVTPNDSTVGTLAIYSLMCEGSRRFPDGSDRMISRSYADFVQSQVVGDIRRSVEPQWSRRQVWDRSYSESRTCGVPSMILETLSHQNFADMKYGLDPSFRFIVSRAVYKGILKFLSSLYGDSYVVQPLPVRCFRSSLEPADSHGNMQVRLSWKARADSLEPTAFPKGYILQRRFGNGLFDEGQVLRNVRTGEDGLLSVDVPLVRGEVNSFRIVAYNDGGKSFPSEVMAVGVPAGDCGKKVLIVNNFTRVSAPAWFDSGALAGFDFALDGGVAAGRELSYGGTQYQFRRELPWVDDDNPGFGASWGDEAELVPAGNSFDYVALHGSSILKAGYSFESASREAFCEDFNEAYALDLICGKQLRVPSGRPGASPDRFEVFSPDIRQSLLSWAKNGGHILVSGANIGTDIFDRVFPVGIDSAARQKGIDFAAGVLGFGWRTNYASRHGRVMVLKDKHIDLYGKLQPFSFYNKPGREMYCVETPDGILPATPLGSTFLRYSDTNIPAAVTAEFGSRKCVAMGFPFEVITDSRSRDILMEAILSFFSRQD